MHVHHIQINPVQPYLIDIDNGVVFAQRGIKWNLNSDYNNL